MNVEPSLYKKNLKFFFKILLLLLNFYIWVKNIFNYKHEKINKEKVIIIK
jgi:hypothetical protein